MFRAFGHTNSSVLDGGLPAWESTLNVEESSHSPSTPKPVQYPPPSLDGNVIRGIFFYQICVQHNNLNFRLRTNDIEQFQV